MSLITVEAFAPSQLNQSRAIFEKSEKYVDDSNRSQTLLKFTKKEDSENTFFLNENDQLALGVVGTKMALVVLISEYVLKTSGCGLPAGPYGIIGAVEGISYLGVIAVTALSIYKKVQTGSGLPAGPKGLLGLAEGLSFLAIFVGIGVLAFQIVDYGYLPNAVPMEGGMCN